MKIGPYIDRLESSPQYKEFSKKYSDAYLVAGFFVLDLEMHKNIHQIDFYIPSKKKIAAFTLDQGVTVQILDTMNNKLPGALDIRTNIDLDALPGIVGDEMKNRGITDDIKKIVAIIQNIEGKKVWNLNCVLSGMGILKTHVDDVSKTILKMEKVSITDYIQKSPVIKAQLEKAMGKSGEDGSNAPNSPAQGVRVADPKVQLEQLNKLEQAIEKEKAQLNEKLKATEKSVKKIVKEVKSQAPVKKAKKSNK